jgi:predicted GIY-YIG superfamily endonuclease
MDNVAYGGFIGSVWVRAKVSAAPVAETVCRLNCSAYFVEEKGSALEEEKKMKHAHRSEYQKLLEEVKQRLKANG